MKIPFLISLLLISTACHSLEVTTVGLDKWSEAEQQQAKRAVADFASAVVSVEGAGWGTGVLVKEPGQGSVVSTRSTIFTAAHVLKFEPRMPSFYREKTSNRIHIDKRPPLTADLLLKDSRQDLAILSVDQTALKSAVRFGRAKRGQRVLLLGRSRRSRLRAVAGRVLMVGMDLPPSLFGIKNHGVPIAPEGVFFVSGKCRPGDSGGPVIALDGRLLGITIGGSKSLGLTLVCSIKSGLSRNQKPKNPGSLQAKKEVLGSFGDLHSEIEYLRPSLERHGYGVGYGSMKKCQELAQSLKKEALARDKVQHNRTQHIRWFWREYLKAIG
jgi:hypothetical protein